jgi:multidrug efflux pump subunit AcrB
MQPSPQTFAGLKRTSGVVAWFAANPVAANLLMAVFLVGGLVQGFGLSAQLFPTINPGVVTITTAYPGATPSEVADGITRRVEEAVIGIDGVDRVLSSARENVGTVTVELKDGVNALTVRNDLETAVDRLADFPPVDAEQPDIVVAQTVSDVISLVVSSELSEAELRRGAELLEQELLALPSVSMVSMLGTRAYEISIEIREETLRRFDLTISEVANAIRRSSLNLASGELRTEAGDLLLRTNSKRERGEDFVDIPLRSDSDGSVLRLGDVATIHDAFADVDLINEFDDRQSVFVRVQKSESEDALSIAADVKALIQNYEPASGVDIAVWQDQTEALEGRLSLLVRNGMLGFALVFLFLVLMLDLRLALWVAMGVPISFLGAFLVFDFFGVNLNMISLFALIVVLGVVVDDALVVGENIVTEQESGKKGLEGAIAGVRGVFSPVFIGVLTTMAAFAPLLLVTGTFGQIFLHVPIVVIAVLTVSLIEVFLILPAHLAHPGKWSRWPLDLIQVSIGNGVKRFRDELFAPVLGQAVRFRYLSLLAGIGLLVLAATLVGSGAVRFIFFPALEADYMRAELEFPVGTPFAVTQEAAERIVAGARQVNKDVGGTSFKSVSVTIGGRISSGGGPGGGTSSTVASHLASIQVQLNDEPLRTLSARELERLWRQTVGPVPGVEKLSYVAEFFRGGSSLGFDLSHQNDGKLLAAVSRLTGFLENQPAVYGVQDSISLGKRQFDIELTPAGEAAGLTAADVARQLRQNFFGEEVQRIQRGRQELKVMVRYPKDQRSSTRDLFNVRINLADGTAAPLSAMAGVVESRSYSEVNRIDGRRIISISGEVDTALATPGEVNAEALALIPQLKAEFPGLQVTQGGFGRDQSRDLGSLAQLMLVSILIIYGLLAAQLKGYIQPLIVLSGVPFGAAGALVGHYLLGFDLSFISLFGMVALSGVVVNDSLVLVDRFNHLRRTTDLSAIDAVIAASRRRFRAIFLTTVTTALGLMPMLFETSIQAQFLIPMAVSLATGIVFASFIILFLVPALIVITEDFRQAPQSLQQRLSRNRANGYVEVQGN